MKKGGGRASTTRKNLPLRGRVYNFRKGAKFDIEEAAGSSRKKEKRNSEGSYNTGQIAWVDLLSEGREGKTTYSRFRGLGTLPQERNH